MSRFNKKKAHYEQLVRDLQSGKVAKRAEYLASCTDIRGTEIATYRKPKGARVTNDNKLPVSSHGHTGVDLAVGNSKTVIVEATVANAIKTEYTIEGEVIR